MAKDGKIMRFHLEEVDVYARFRANGSLEPCVIVLKDCRIFRIDEILGYYGFRQAHHGKRTARCDICLDGRETQLYLEHRLETPPPECRTSWFGG